jgi:hypothetical protein
MSPLTTSALAGKQHHDDASLRSTGAGDHGNLAFKPSTLYLGPASPNSAHPAEFHWVKLSFIAA